MNDLQRDFLEIVTQIRSHLEYQRTLGVRHVRLPVSQPAAAPARSTPQTAADQVVKPPVVSDRPPMKPTGLAAVEEELSNCTRCSLTSGRTAQVFGEGNIDADLVFVGDAPGREEGGRGRPFTGAAGRLLTDIIVKGMNLKPGIVYLCTLTKCLPSADRGPKQEEIEACEVVFQKQIQAIKPRVIVALGERTAQALLKTQEGISTLRGRWHSYQDIPLMATFSPAHLVDHPGDKKFTWADIKLVMVKLGMTVTKG